MEKAEKLRRLFIEGLHQSLLSDEFIGRLIRAETFENYKVYSKAVRVTLIALYQSEAEFIENDFRDKLDSIYRSTQPFMEVDRGGTEIS